MGNIVIDHINNISADENSFHAELGTLNYLGVGLFSLAGNTRAIEKELNKVEGLVFNMGTHLGGDVRRTAMIACFFHWFSNSIYNYVRLVRYIDGINLGIKFKSKIDESRFYNDYLKSVIPDILIWRHKVTAHFARTKPQNENIATLEATVMYPITFIKPYLRAGALRWSSNGKESNLPEWALTKSFEELSARYWPEFKLDPV